MKIKRNYKFSHKLKSKREPKFKFKKGAKTKTPKWKTRNRRAHKRTK